MLEQCRELFLHAERPDLADAMAQAQRQAPLEVPADFQGPPITRMYALSLTPSQRLEALACVEAAVAADYRTSATQKRGLGGFLEAWREFARTK